MKTGSDCHTSLVSPTEIIPSPFVQHELLGMSKKENS
jgi:hypothetical protein